MNADSIFISEKDYLRIRNLIGSLPDHEYEDLDLELDRATLVSDNEVPPNLVTMNSQIKYRDVHANNEFIVTIVYPVDSDTSVGKVSILAPVGTALIGLSENQRINWKFPNGKAKTLEVLEVIYQPEASNDWHL